MTDLLTLCACGGGCLVSERGDLDNDSTGDLLFVNTNMLDLMFTFDPTSKHGNSILSVF